MGNFVAAKIIGLYINTDLFLIYVYFTLSYILANLNCVNWNF